MNILRDGGPMFPVELFKGTAQFTDKTFHPGASVRDFFAAHAGPAPEWFESDFPEKAPQMPKCDDHGLTDHCSRILNGSASLERTVEVYAIDPERAAVLRKLVEDHQAHHGKFSAWQTASNLYREARWRFLLADQMVIARGVNGPRSA